MDILPGFDELFSEGVLGGEKAGGVTAPVPQHGNLHSHSVYNIYARRGKGSTPKLFTPLLTMYIYNIYIYINIH